MPQDSAPSPPTSSRAAPLAAAVAALPYLPKAPLRFLQSDDYWFAGANSWAEVARAFGGDWLTGAVGAGGWLRPVPRLFFWLDDTAWGIARPWGYHITNVSLHAACAALMALVATRLARGDGRAGLAAGIAFGLFPPAAGAVGWVAARTDLLALAGMLAAMLVLLSEARLLVRAGLLGAAALFAYGSKESAYLLPAYLGAAALAEAVSAPDRRRLAENAALVGLGGALLGAVLAWRYLRLGGLGGYASGPAGDPPLDLGGVFAAFAERGAYLAAPLVAVAVALWPRTPRPLRAAAALGAVLFAAAVAPVLRLPLLDYENDRYLYLAGLGWALCAGAVVARVPGHNALWIVLAAALGLQAWHRDAIWFEASRTTERVVRDLVRGGAGAGRLPIVIAYERMEVVPFEHAPLHDALGGKILPWGQAKWAFQRRTGRYADWGFQPEHLDTGARLLLIRHSLAVEAFDAVPVADMRRTLETTTTLDFRWEGDGWHYGFAWADATFSLPEVPCVATFRDGAVVLATSAQGAPPLRRARHTMDIGVLPRPETWHWDPQYADRHAQVHGGEAGLFRLEPIPLEATAP
jgi:hypothetical protein